MTEQFDPGQLAGAATPVAINDHGMPEGQVAAAAMDAAVRSAFDIAEQLFHGCADDLTRLQSRLRLGETEELKEAVGAARALRSATQAMLDERNRVDKLRKEVGGGCGGAGSLDLDAARDEIGRRLACLRRASGG